MLPLYCEQSKQGPHCRMVKLPLLCIAEVRLPLPCVTASGARASGCCAVPPPAAEAGGAAGRGDDCTGVAIPPCRSTVACMSLIRRVAALRAVITCATVVLYSEI